MASVYQRNGTNPHYVQRILRHADMRTTTSTYGHLDVEDLRAAVNTLPATGKLARHSTAVSPTTGIPVQLANSALGNRQSLSGIEMADLAGFEPAAFGFVVRRSIQLS